MHLSPLQYVLATIGYKNDITDQFSNPPETSPFTQKALADGTKIYCKSMPKHRVAGADFKNNLQSQPSIYINSRRNSEFKQNPYKFDLAVEHESVHVTQAGLIAGMYDKNTHPLAFEINDIFSLALLKESEAYGYEFLKACKDYKLTGDFQKMETYANAAEFSLPPALRPSLVTSPTAKAEIDKILAEKNDAEIVKDFILNFAEDNKARKLVAYSGHAILLTYLKNNAAQNYFNYTQVLGFANPAEDMFSQKFDVNEIKTYMKKGERDYFQAMDIEEKTNFACAITDMSDINEERYQPLVAQARAMRL